MDRFLINDKKTTGYWWWVTGLDFQSCPAHPLVV